MSIMDLKKNAPKGEFLAYINKKEAAMLKKAGGSGELVNGIPSFRPQDMGNKENQAVSANNTGIGGLGAGRTDGGDHSGDYSSKTAEKEKAKYEKQFGGVSPTGSRPRGFFDRINTYNSNFQKKANIKLAQKRAFQKYQNIEQYVDLMDDYGLTAEEIAEKVAANPSYGYDFSDLGLGKEYLGSNIGTNLEKYRANRYDVNSNIPGRAGIIGNFLANKVRPDTQVTAKNTLQKARDYNTLATNPNLTRDMIMDLGNRGKTPDQINPPSGRDSGTQPYIPYLPQEEVEDEYTNDFTYRFGNNQNVGRDVTDATYAADGGIMGTRARKAMGGIMGRVDQRQQFFLGGIGKAIKGVVGGVVDATKKVLKSDIGKAALMYAGGVYLGGGNIFSASAYNPANFLGSKASGGYFANMGSGLMGLKGKYDKLGTFGKIATMGGLGLGLSMIPGLNKAKPNETNFSDRGGPLLNSQGDGSQGSISREIQEAYASGDSQRIMELQKYYNYMLPSQDAVQDLSLPSSLPYPNYAEGGRIGKAEGGLMDLGGMEKDYRNDGGFVPIGEYEKKDDVPARLSVNEFVFTADAVRNAGEGDIDKGAEVMENMMKNLENGGTVSEESQGNQGNTGAQDMFSVSQRLGEVI